MDKKLKPERVRIEYVPISESRFWDRNPKKHDIGAIIASIRQHGFRDPPTFDRTLGAIVEGNGRTEALLVMKSNGDEAPRGVDVREDGEWLMPMNHGLDSATDVQAEAYGVDHNAITISGGDFGFSETLGLFNQDELAEILADAGEFDVAVGCFDADDLAALISPPLPGVTAGPVEGEAPSRPVVTCPKCSHEFGG